MKKKFFNLIVAIALLMLNVNDTVAQTTTVGKGDLPAFELKGNVKSCKWINVDDDGNDYDNVHSFNAKGECAYFLNDCDDVKRNSAGRISSAMTFCGDEGSTVEEWYYDHAGRMVKQVCKYYLSDSEPDIVTYTYEYNSKGFVATMRLSGEDYDNKWSITRTYTYLATDANGNWTKRKVVDSGENKTYTETRVITYY